MLSHAELVEVIRWFAVAYLEVETARRPIRALRAQVTPALCSRLATGRRQPIAGAVRAGGATYTLVGDGLSDAALIRAAVTVHRGDDVGALLLAFRQGGRGGWQLDEVEAPDRALLAGQ